MVDQTENRYKIIHLLSKDAAGGMYLAEDTMLGRKVVYRHMDVDAGGNRSSSWAEEMATYAGKLCAFQHPNIITIYDVPIDETGFSLVTQYVEGETLAERLKEGPLREFGAYRMAHDLLEALHTAHDAGVYHGALHTGSIKRLPRATSGFRYLILDLGLNTLATMVKGEDIHIADPVLLAPELHSDNPEPDESSDLFMVGQLCYTALAGGHPFSGRPAEECAPAHLAGELPPLTDYRPDLNPDFAAWVMKMCSGNRSDRPASIDDAADALHAFKIVDPDANAATASVPIAVAVPTVPMAAVTVPMAAVTGKVQPVPVATLTAKQQVVPVATVKQSALGSTVKQSALGATGPQSSLSMTGGVSDFSAGDDHSNQKMFVTIGVLVALIAVGVGLKFLLPAGDKEEEKTELVVLAKDVKAHLHEVELIGIKGDMGLVNLDGEKTLDWVVFTGANVSGKRDQMSERAYRMNPSSSGNFTEAARKGIPVFFEVGGKELTPMAATSAKAGNAKAGQGWNISLRVPEKHKGSMLVTLYMFQEWCALDVEVTMHNGEKIKLQNIPKQDPGVLCIPIEIPKVRKGKFYNIKITASKDTTGDFSMGLNAVHIEGR